ncbi:MAG: hypothetical protein U9N76_08455 [Candidatus Marinimicrobia bacterium]|nr:hypothetical protein [Candidatus Neomarinimicrobiota bacterium]
MKNLIKVVLILAVALLMMSCGEDGKLTVINKSSEEIDVTIDGVSDDDDLSYNEKSETQTWFIATGDEKNVPITATGDWLLGYDTEVTIGPGDDVLHEINSNAGKIQINNYHPSLSIWYVYISEENATDWGNDQLGSDVIAPGEFYAWYASSGFTWDVKLVDGNATAYEIYGTTDLNAEGTIHYNFTQNSIAVPNSPIKTKYQDVVRKNVATPNVSVKKIGKVK